MGSGRRPRDVFENEVASTCYSLKWNRQDVVFEEEFQDEQKEVEDQLPSSTGENQSREVVIFHCGV